MGAVMAGLARMQRMQRRAILLSSSTWGPSGLPPPLKTLLLAKGLMPSQPTSCFSMAAQRPLSSVTTLVLAV
jgi:hypothetical protein